MRHDEQIMSCANEARDRHAKFLLVPVVESIHGLT
jgi:hypothetical protein